MNPRVMACFSGAVDPGTIKDGMKLVSVTSPSSVVPLNQVILNQEQTCVFAKPDRVLNQQSRYLLVITDALTDFQSKPVTPDPGFTSCLQGSGADPYCQDLGHAIQAVRSTGFKENITGASLFTTLSATSWLERAHDFVATFTPGLVLPAGLRSSFDISDLRSMTWQPDNSGLPPQNIPLDSSGEVGSIGFGLFLSPNFLNTSGTDARTITTDPAAPISVSEVLGGFIPGFVPVSFHVFVPASRAPSTGWPVVIYGHGLGDSQFGAPTYIASNLAKNGFATLALEFTGHGYGANSTVKLTTNGGNTYTVATPGRGVQIDPSKPIGAQDGCVAPGAIAIRDCGRQTAVDLFALVKTIQSTGGLGMRLDPQHIYYVGQSFGSTVGTLFHAVEPSVKAAVLNAGGGPSADIARLAITGRSIGIEYLNGLELLNGSSKDPTAYFHDAFDDEYVYRDQAPKIDSVPGALQIQAAFEAAEWLGMLGDPLAFAPHLKTSPLNGVPAKSTLFQSSVGDLEVPNPTNAAMVRAADGLSSSILLQFNKAVFNYGHSELLSVFMPIDPTKPISPTNALPILPHRILSNPTTFEVPAQTSIALAEQQTVASFFLSDGQSLPDSNLFLNGSISSATPMFQLGAVPPEGLNFLIPSSQ